MTSEDGPRLYSAQGLPRSVGKVQAGLPTGAGLQALPNHGGFLVVAKDDTLAPSNGADPPDAFDYDSPAAQPVPADPQYPPARARRSPATRRATGLAADEVPAYKIDTPWAVDAEGTQLPTTYAINGMIGEPRGR
jgi:hypothetical protein